MASKDLRLAMDLAKELRVDLPAGTAATQLYGSVLAAAHEDLDYAAISRHWEKP